MASITGLQSGNFTDIDVTYSIAIDGDVGQNGQVLSSDGTNTLWINGSSIDREDLTAADSTITISGGSYDGQVARTIQTNKVPNALTFTGTATGTYDGSSALTINLTDNDNQLTLVEQNGITITDLGGFNRGIATDIDADTIVFNGTSMEVAKVPNTLTFTGTATGTFDGSSALSINLTDTNTQLNLTEGNGITITNTGGLNRTIALNADSTTLSDNVGSGQAGVLKVPQDLTAGHNIVFSSGTTYNGGTARTITSSPYFFHSVYDPTSTDFDSLTTSYSSHFLTNVRADITAEETTLCVELLTYNYTISSNRTFYLRLVDNGGTEFSSGTNQGGYGTGTRNTERITQVADETDKQEVRQTWFIQGLTVGNTYTFQPQAKTSSTLNYIAAGGTYPATIMRLYYLPPAGI